MTVIDHEAYPTIVHRILSHLPDTAAASVFRATSKALRAKVDAVVASKMRHVVITAAYAPGPPMLVFRHPSGSKLLPPLTAMRLAALLRANIHTLGYPCMATADAFLRKRFADVEVIEIASPIAKFGIRKLFPHLEVLRLSGRDTLVCAGFIPDCNKSPVTNWEANAEFFFGLRPRKVAIEWNMEGETLLLASCDYLEELHVILGRCHQPSETKNYIPAVNLKRVMHIFLHFTHFESVGPLSDQHTARLVFELGQIAGANTSLCLIDAHDFLSQLPAPASIVHPSETTSTRVEYGGGTFTVPHPPVFPIIVDPDCTGSPPIDGFPTALGSAILEISVGTWRQADQVAEVANMLDGLTPVPRGDGYSRRGTVPSYLPLWTTTSQEYKGYIGTQLYGDLSGF